MRLRLPGQEQGCQRHDGPDAERICLSKSGCCCWAGAVPPVCWKGQQRLYAPPAALTRDDFFLTRVVGDFEDEILYHFDGSGEILETVSLGAKRMTYEQVLRPNDTLLLNNSYLLEQFSLRTHEVTPFANRKNSMRTMLDASGNLTLWYTGEEIVVFDFGSNTEVWRETVKCKKSKDPNFAYYCFGMLSPRQSKAAYRVTEGEYALVDLKSAQKVVISNAGWHPFFSPDDQCFLEWAASSI